MEHTILSVALKSREDFDLINQYIKLKPYTTEFKILWGFISDYYRRDHHAPRVDGGVFAELVRATTTNEKHADKFLRFADEAAELDVSGANVKEVIFQARIKEAKVELATALVNGKDEEKLLEEYQALKRHSSFEEMLLGDVEAYSVDDLSELLRADARRDGVIPIYPKALGTRLDGGLQGSDHMTIMARPEMGKTALVMTIAGGAAKSGFKVLVINNEERINRLMIRQVSNLTGLTIHKIREDVSGAVELAEKQNFGNITFVPLTPGTPKEIDRLVERYNPDLFIVDQLRNLAIPSDSKTNQLEAAAREIRDTGKRWNKVAVSITQAGDSAEGDSIVGMSDIDNSKTGIPGACDVLAGVGANETQKAQGIRVITLSKNKISGDHSSFPCKINEAVSKYTSVEEPKR